MSHFFYFAAKENQGIVPQRQPIAISMSNNNHFVSKQLDGVSYTLRGPIKLTWTKAVASLAGIAAMFPFMILHSLYQVVFPSSRKKIQATMVPKMMAGVEKEFQGEREALLATVGGVVLDLGCGSGPYLKYCKKSEEVVAVEPLVDLHASIRKNGADLNKLTLVTALTDVPDEKKFDLVILGNVRSAVFSEYLVTLG